MLNRQHHLYRYDAAACARVTRGEVWNSTHPRTLMHYSGLEFHFKVKSRVQRAIQIRQSRVQSMVTERLWEIETQDLPKFIP